MTVKPGTPDWHRVACAHGKAGEYLVCADLLVAGWSAVIAQEGLRYDVIAERNGQFLRIAVKSTFQPVPRRKGARDAYKFQVSRRPLRKHVHYTPEDADMIALVALDTKQVGYIPIAECPTLVWIYAENAEPAERRFGPKVSFMRRFAQISIEAVINGK